MPNHVLASLTSSDESRCVDVFAREDGSFGFEEYRAEADGNAQWQSLGKYSALVFSSGAAALTAAQERVAWLDQSLVWRW